MIAPAAVPRLALRVRAGLAYSANWWQAARFLVVGTSGFAINLLVFSALVHGIGVEYRLAAVCSNVVALSSNFMWNRRWTFDASEGRARLQAPRFMLVSVGGLIVNVTVLQFAVEFMALSKLPSEILASAVAAPVNFLGSRQWAFSARRERVVSDGSCLAESA